MDADFAAWETPYLLPLTLTPEKVRSVNHYLRQHGICSQTWPDLPPEVSASKKEFNVSRHTAETRLFLPIHQSLTGKHMEYILEKTRNAIRG